MTKPSCQDVIRRDTSVGCLATSSDCLVLVEGIPAPPLAVFGEMRVMGIGIGTGTETDTTLQIQLP